MMLANREIIAKSYWKQGVNPATADSGPLPPSCDAVVIGAGFTGLSVALHLARAGRSVVVLDANEIGHGGSSRSGGMCGPSFHQLGYKGLVSQYGEAKTWDILAEGLASLEYFLSFLRDEQIDCDLRLVGRFRGAATEDEFRTLVAESNRLKEKIGLQFHPVERHEQHGEIGTDLYHGGVVYERDAGINPYKLVTGLAARASAAGARIFEHQTVNLVRDDNGGKKVRVGAHEVRAHNVVVTTNGYTGPSLQSFRRRIIPVSAGVVATEDLGPEKILEMTPKLRMHGGTHRLVFWYRPTPDGRRMIFGGRVMDSKKRPENISSDIMSLARRVFPQLEEAKVEYCWHGNIAYTFDHAPHLGEIDGIHYAMGYCGSGVTRSLYFARQLSRKMLGQPDSETAHDDLEFKTRPFYTGNPWFMPLILRWHVMADKLSGH